MGNSQRTPRETAIFRQFWLQITFLIFHLSHFYIFTSLTFLLFMFSRFSRFYHLSHFLHLRFYLFTICTIVLKYPTNTAFKCTFTTRRYFLKTFKHVSLIALLVLGAHFYKCLVMPFKSLLIYLIYLRIYLYIYLCIYLFRQAI